MASHQGFWGETEALRDHGSHEEGTSSQEDNAQPKLGLSHGDFSHSHTGFAFSLVIPIHVILHPRHRSGVTRHTAAEYARARLLIQPPHVERLETRQRHESRAHTRTRSRRVCINHHAAVRRDRMEAISLSGHAPMVSTPTPDPGHKTRLPHPHTITCQPRSGAQRRSTPRMAASTHALHPPAHVSAQLQQYDHSHSTLARHSSASTSHRHLCSAAHPSYIPLAPEGRASADSQA